MTIPTNLPKSNLDLGNIVGAVSSILSNGLQIKIFCDNLIGQIQTTGIDASRLFSLLGQGVSEVRTLSQLNQTVGLDLMAQLVISGYAGSLSSDTTATINAIQSMINWIIANVPKDSSGFVEVYQWNADGSQTARQFSPSDAAGLVAMLQAIKSTIG